MRFATWVFALSVAACRTQPQPAVNRDPPTSPVPSASAVASASASVAAEPPPSAPPPWPNARRVKSADASFSVGYPPVFKKASARGDSIVLTSDVSEPSWGKSGGADIVFGIELAKLRASVASILAKYVTLTDGTERSFVPQPGFAEAERGVNGADGYVITIGVEGTGDVIHVFTTKDGTSWRLDCNYCCGLVSKPKMTSEAQLTMCSDVMHAFQAEH